MAANRNDRPALDDVLAHLAAAPRPPDAQTLRVWTARYPNFAAEIIDFATDLHEMEAARAQHDVAIVDAEDVDVVVNRTMSRVQTLLDAIERPEAVTDLTAEISAVGLDLDSFQRAVGIDRSILDCLLARLVKPATLPAKLVSALGEILNRSSDRIRDYLRLPPHSVAAYKSRKRPQTTQVDFAMIVQQSRLSEPEITRWLSEPPDPLLRE
jgi:hypothetical protein